MMPSQLDRYEKRLRSIYQIDRIMKYLSLTGIGIALWINDLWQIVLHQVNKAERQLDHWVIRRVSRFFFDRPPVKVYPILDLADTIGFCFFIVFTVWLGYWAYMDTYVRVAHGEIVWSFRKKLVVGLLVNVITYILLTFLTSYALAS